MRLIGTAITESSPTSIPADALLTPLSINTSGSQPITIDLHFAVVRASHNEVLIELYRGLTEAVTDSVAITSTMDVSQHVGHTELVEAIAAQDAERAGHEAGKFLDDLISELPAQGISEFAQSS
ncbi:hypothetical protein MHPYR_50048 [uncultured Mycobacterium sp.]|uniref:GntR C-terminal domain-containing protein n=1 Tax=uncultured Mycobacterium sp. TaxID=171292 RepID=A0A1Y5PP16_9MYCO|nr:hypothetical protein MHPYR_50048 [uncultured Mycobacterium sp.]